MSKILFITSECWPLIKTGGLADVSSSLPVALQQLGEDVITLLPAYQGVKQHLKSLEHIATIDNDFFEEEVKLLSGTVSSTGQHLWLLDAPSLFDRDGGPYQDQNKQDWQDNAYRYSILCRVACEIAMGRAVPSWKPDVVHCNDWQTGLVPALLSLEKDSPATIFTIHNIAYQGIYMRHIFDNLKLPDSWWHHETLEFHGNFSFLKGGLIFADRITTVSPSYAEEIKTSDKGCGMDGLLRHKASVLNGILNGVDYSSWDPSIDTYIKYPYSEKTLKNKRKNKQALQKELRLKGDKKLPVIGIVSRFAHQKGIDLVIEQIHRFIQQPVQWAILGSGDQAIEESLEALAKEFPDKVGVKIGYDEGLAHRIEAGADIFLMPSRYEPCGLNQMYSLRYGTVPVVTKTGGLADTVLDADDESGGTGFLVAQPNVDEVEKGLKRALSAYKNKAQWLKLRRRGMAQDFSWQESATAYLHLYEDAMLEKGGQGNAQIIAGDIAIKEGTVRIKKRRIPVVS
ncbi:MAG: glycogen synthase GlgA [Pseudomonadales bacterium]|nr:glycogen synthase GlgA [Pseudomonadales bacterium]